MANFEYENELRKKGITIIGGTDEAEEDLYLVQL